MPRGAVNSSRAVAPAPGTPAVRLTGAHLRDGSRAAAAPWQRQRGRRRRPAVTALLCTLYALAGAPQRSAAQQAAAAAAGAAAPTLSRDKAALLAFKQGLTDDQGLLASWNASTDPCRDAWAFVGCACNGTDPPLSPAACAAAAPAAAGFQRVLTLQVDPVEATGGRQLAGPISPSLGALSQLRTLDLHDQQLTGSIPNSLSALSKLTQFILRQNQLSGPYRPWLAAALPGVQNFFTGSNNFSGPLSSALCAASDNVTFFVRGNPGLCGALPACLLPHLADSGLNGTALQDLQDPSQNPSGRPCPLAPPRCSRREGCLCGPPPPPRSFRWQ